MQRYASLRQGLVGAWCPSVSGPYGYSLPDISGYGNHGTLTNMDPGSDWVVSGGKGALDFDGSNDRIDCGAIAAHAFGNTDNFSVCCWFNARSTTSERGLVTRINVSDQGWALTISSGTVRFPAWNLGPSVAIATDTTYHVCAVNRAGTREIYLNGVLQNTNAFGSIQANTVNTVIGRYYGDFAGFIHNGWIDDCRIYSRVLTEQEIRLLASERGIGLKPERQRNRYMIPRNRSSRFLGFPS